MKMATALLSSVLWLVAHGVRRDCLVVLAVDGWHVHRIPL